MIPQNTTHDGSSQTPQIPTISLAEPKMAENTDKEGITYRKKPTTTSNLLPNERSFRSVRSNTTCGRRVDIPANFRAAPYPTNLSTPQNGIPIKSVPNDKQVASHEHCQSGVAASITSGFSMSKKDSDTSKSVLNRENLDFLEATYAEEGVTEEGFLCSSLNSIAGTLGSGEVVGKRPDIALEETPQQAPVKRYVLDVRLGTQISRETTAKRPDVSFEESGRQSEIPDEVIFGRFDMEPLTEKKKKIQESQQQAAMKRRMNYSSGISAHTSQMVYTDLMAKFSKKLLASQRPGSNSIDMEHSDQHLAAAMEAQPSNASDLRYTHSSLQEALSNRDEKIKSLEAMISDIKHEKYWENSQMAALQGVNASLEKELSSSSSLVETLRTEVADREIELERAIKHATLLEKQLREVQLDMERLRKTTIRADEHIKIVEVFKKKTAERDLELKEQDKIIKYLENTVDKLEKDQEEIEKMFNRSGDMHDKEMSDLRVQLREKDEIIDGLRAHIVGKDKVIDRSMEEVKVLDSILAQYRVKIVEKECIIQRFKSESAWGDDSTDGEDHEEERKEQTGKAESWDGSLSFSDEDLDIFDADDLEDAPEAPFNC